MSTKVDISQLKDGDKDASLLSTVDTLAELQGLGEVNDGKVRLMAERTAGNGGGGRFIPRAGDYSSQVAADEVTPGEGDGGRWIAFGNDKTGASGAWERDATAWVSHAEWYGGGTEKSASENSATIQKALNRAKVGGRVVLGAGTYNHNGVSLPQGVSLEGSGKGETFINNSGAFSSISAVDTNFPFGESWSLSSLTLTASSITVGSIGIEATKVRGFSVRDVNIENHDIGIDETITWRGNYNGILIRDCNTGWRFNAAAPGETGTPNARYDVHITDCDNGMVYDGGVDTIQWFGGAIERCENAIVIDPTTPIRQVLYCGYNLEENGTPTSQTIIQSGGATLGPDKLKFSSCRIFNPTAWKTANSLVLDYVRASTVIFDDCKFYNFTNIADVSNTAGELVFYDYRTDNTDTLLTYQATTIPESTAPKTLQFKSGKLSGIWDGIGYGSGGVTSPKSSIDEGGFLLGDGASSPDVKIQRVASNVAGMGSGDSFRVENDGFIKLVQPNGIVLNLWADDSSRLRVSTSVPSDRNTDGVVVGTQT